METEKKHWQKVVALIFPRVLANAWQTKWKCDDNKKTYYEPDKNCDRFSLPHKWIILTRKLDFALLISLQWMQSELG